MSEEGALLLTTGDPLAEYIRRHNVETESQEQFRNLLYDHVIDTIDNRIDTQMGNVPNEHLHQYASNLFLGKKLDSTHPSRMIQSEKCVLEVRIHRANGLAPKDVTGTSDPYCIVGLAPQDLYTNLWSKKQNTKYNTSVNMENLNPEWNECLEIPVRRDQIDGSFLHVQVWDHDDEESVSTAIAALKDIKGVRGMGRYMKEVAQTITKKDNNDDFMGFSAMPLKNIPLEGIEKWYTLRAHGALQGITGRIKIGLRIICPRLLMADLGHPGKHAIQINKPRIDSDISDEIIYGGILLLIVTGRHDIYKDLMSDEEGATLDGWDGQLQNVDETLLREFECQRNLPKLMCAIARWEVYCREHIQLPDGIKMLCIESLLKKAEISYEGKDDPIFRPIRPLTAPAETPSAFTFEILPKSFDDFLRHCYTKIESHHTMYPVKRNDTIIRIGELLICLKTLREMKLYLTAKLVDTSMFGSGDISKDISESLRKSMSKLYMDLCIEHHVIGANIANLDNGDPIEEYNVVGLVKLVDTIHTALMNGRAYYQPVFKKVLKIDYMAVVLGAISTRMSEDLEDILYKVNKAISSVKDPVDGESSDKSTSMFQLYLSLKDYSVFMNDLLGGGITNATFSKLSLKQLTNGVEKVNTHIDALKGFHEWFRPTILRWLQMSRGRTVQRLTAAVQLDKVKRMDDIVKHSSSAVDAIACLNSVVQFWLQIKWPDVIDGYLIATRITEDISNGVELYADLVHDKLKGVGFFDDEGQFDVTEELCLALNNLEKVKLFLIDVLRDMEINSLASDIDGIEEGPTGEKLLYTFNSLIANADTGMYKKIIEVTSVVGKKMEPDIIKFLQEFVRHILKVQPKNRDGNPLNGHSSDYELNKKDWEAIAENGVGPLLNYLTTNIMTLKEWLCDSNFRILLDMLWKVTLRCIRDVILTKYRWEKPFIFSQSRHVLEEHLTAFFHADGEGLKLEKMFSVEEYKVVDAELRMRSASSQDLMRLFYAQKYEEQDSQDGAPFGILNVYAWYDDVASEIKVDVISAENLTPQDMNGFSDPFVQITLVPKVMFPTHRTVQTLEQKKTLNPVYVGESFSFKVGREDAAQEGATIVFTILDYDVIGRNDLEGECFLPIFKLHGLHGTSAERGNRSFKMNITQPRQSSASSSKQESPEREVVTDSQSDQNASPTKSHSSHASSVSLALLRQRIAYDRDASEFCRWRRKLEDSVQKDDLVAPEFFKNLLN